MNDSFLEKLGHVFVWHLIGNVCAEFKVDRCSCFRTGARQVFTTQKPSPSEISLTMKTAKSN